MQPGWTQVGVQVLALLTAAFWVVSGFDSTTKVLAVRIDGLTASIEGLTRSQSAHLQKIERNREDIIRLQTRIEERYGVSLEWNHEEEGEG